MSLEAALVARVAATSSLVSLIGARCFPVLVPETAMLPAIAYSLVSDVREEVMGVNAGLRHARVQLTILANTYAQALGIQAACEMAFNRYRGTSAGVVIQDTFIENTAAGLDSGSGQEAGEGTMTRTMDLLFHYEA